jgi:hypothetical protein
LKAYIRRGPETWSGEPPETLPRQFFWQELGEEIVVIGFQLFQVCLGWEVEARKISAETALKFQVQKATLGNADHAFRVTI